MVRDATCRFRAARTCRWCKPARCDAPISALRSTAVLPVVDFGAEATSRQEFAISCQRLAASLGVTGADRWRAHFIAKRDSRFDASA
jgi:hypothetical protein